MGATDTTSEGYFVTSVIGGYMGGQMVMMFDLLIL